MTKSLEFYFDFISPYSFLAYKKLISFTKVNKLNIITTNADIVVSDTKNYTTNDNGIPYFSDNLPTQYQLACFNKAAPPTPSTASTLVNMYPNLNIKTSSIDLVAQNFPASMIRSYYTIRSSIIEYPIATAGIHNINNYQYKEIKIDIKNLKGKILKKSLRFNN